MDSMICLRLDQEILDKLDDATVAFHTNRSLLMRFLLEEFLTRQYTWVQEELSGQEDVA